MNVQLTKDEFHDLIMTYIIELSEEEGKMINEGNLIHSPLFDSFLKFIYDRPLGDLRLVYSKVSPKVKLSYNRLKGSIDEADKVGVYL